MSFIFYFLEASEQGIIIYERNGERIKRKWKERKASVE